MTTHSNTTEQYSSTQRTVKNGVSSARTASSRKKVPVECATTMLPHIVAFDDLTSPSCSFACRFLEVATASDVLHQDLREQMLDLIEDQLLVNITYRYWAQYAISQQRTGLVLKDVKPSRSSLICDVIALVHNDGFIDGDDATRAFLVKTETLLVKGRSRNKLHPLQQLLEESISIGGDTTKNSPHFSEETVFPCLRKAASETVVSFPSSPWLRCICAMLSLVEEANRRESSLGFLDALLLLRSLDQRGKRVLLLKTIMQYCEV